MVNNVRFLILPWVKIPHLASKVRALKIRQLASDWFAFYRQRVFLLESFVDTTRFRGTCYRAANWVRVGETTGRGKYDRFNQRAEPVKAVFLYPLTKGLPGGAPCVADQLPTGLNIPLEDWRNTPPSVIRLIMQLVARIETLEAEVGQLRARLDQNSSNSSKRPSSDPPQDKAKRPKKEGPEKRLSRPGHRQKLLEATEVREIKPTRCVCGCADFTRLQPYYTHQHIELPPIAMLITHFVLYRKHCQNCGKTGKGYLPHDQQTGFGPRLSALITEIDGIDGNSRETIQAFLASVLGVPISQGAIQKVIDRGTQAHRAPLPGDQGNARATPVNHLDETPWYNRGRLNWLRVMANKSVSLFMVHDHRSKEAFEQLMAPGPASWSATTTGSIRNRATSGKAAWSI